MSTFAPDDLDRMILQRRPQAPPPPPGDDLDALIMRRRPSAPPPPQTDSGPDRVTIDSPDWQDSPSSESDPNKQLITPMRQVRVPGAISNGPRMEVDASGRAYDPSRVLPTDIEFETRTRQDEARYAATMAQQPGVYGRFAANVAGGVDEAVRQAGAGWSGVAQRGVGSVLDEAVLGGAPAASPEDFTGIMSDSTREANAIRGEAAGSASRFVAGLASMPATFLDPKTIAAMLISHSPSAATSKALFNPMAMSAIEQKFGTATMHAVQQMTSNAITGGGFGGAHAAVTGGDVVEGAAQGAAASIPFGVAGTLGVMAGERAGAARMCTAESNRQYREDTGRAFDPSTVRPEARTLEEVPPVRPGEARPEGPAGRSAEVPAAQDRAVPELVEAVPVQPEPAAAVEAEPLPNRTDVASSERQASQEVVAQEPPPSPKPTRPPQQMINPALRAELEAGGVEFDPKTTRVDLISGVKQLREMAREKPPATEAETPVSDARVQPTDPTVELPPAEPVREIQTARSEVRQESQTSPNPTDWAATKSLPELRKLAREAGVSDRGNRPGLIKAIEGKRPEIGQERYFQRVAREAAERIQARKAIPRGRDTGGGTLHEDVIDAGIWLAAKFGDTGDRFFRSQIGYARKLIDENYPHLADHFGDVSRMARKLLREGADPAAKVHKYDDARFEAAVGKVLEDRKGPDRPIKQVIRESTGQTKAEEKVMTASEALVYGLRKEERAANKASRAQRRLDLAETRNRIQTLRTDLEGRARSRALKGVIQERAKGEAVAEKVQTYAERMKDLRDRATDVVERSPFREVRAQFLRSIERTKTTGQLRRLMGKVERATARRQLSIEAAEVRASLRRANTRKMFENYRDEIKKARAEIKLWQTDPATLKRYKTLAELDKGLDDLKDLGYRVTEAIHRDRADRKILVEGKAIARQTAVDEVTAGIKTRKEHKKESIPLPVDREASFAGKAKQAMATPDTVGAMMRSKMARKVLAEDPWDGENLVFRDSQKADDHLRQNIEAAGYKWGSDKLQKLSAAAAGKEAEVLTFKLPDAGEIKGTPAEMMALYATITDKKAAVNITNGAPIRWRRARGESTAEFKLTGNDQSNFIYNLDPKLREVVDRAKKYIESDIRPGLFEAFREQKGYDLEAVEGYWRTKRDMLSQDNPGLIGTMAAHFNQALENLGFLKERSPDKTKPYLIGDFFDDFHDMAHQGAVVTHMTRRVRNAELVFSNSEMREVVQAHFGRGMNKRIADIIEGQKLIFTPPKTSAEKFASMLNRNFARAKLTLNPRTMVKQLGGTFKLLSQVNYWDWVNGMSKVYSPEVTKIMESSPYFRERYDNAIWRRMSPTLGDRSPLLGKSNVPETMGRAAKGWLFTTKAGRAAMGDLIDRIEILNKFDAVSARAAIGTKLAEAKRLGVKDPAKWAEREASMLIRRTNNTNSVLDMSGFAAEHRGSVGWTPILMFTSDSNKSYNVLAAAANEGKGAFGKAAVAVAVDAAFGAAVATFLGAEGYKLIAGGKDDKKKREGAAERLGWAFARNLASMGYGADSTIDLARGAGDVFRGMPLSEVRIMRNPVGETMEDFAKGLLKLAEAAGAEGYFQSGPRLGQNKKIGKLLEGLEKAGLAGADLLGIPISPLYNQTKAIIKAAQ